MGNNGKIPCDYVNSHNKAVMSNLVKSIIFSNTFSFEGGGGC